MLTIPQSLIVCPHSDASIAEAQTLAYRLTVQDATTWTRYPRPYCAGDEKCLACDVAVLQVPRYEHEISTPKKHNPPLPSLQNAVQHSPTH
jgi:hypothetical protein